MDAVEEKFKLIQRNTEEILTVESLKKLLVSGTPINHYIGFEISGKIHLGTGLMCMSKVKDFMAAGVNCTVFLADWHSWINDKLGGVMKAIQKVAVRYFKEGLIASMKCVGGNPEKINFVLGSELYHNNDDFWLTVVDVSKHTSLSRMERSITIMGRAEGCSTDFAKLLYPPMQVADIYAQGINLPHAGLDQRKAMVIGRDVAEKLSYKPLKDVNGNIIKPTAVLHHLILGLVQPPKNKMQDSALKMSKSNPDTCVYIHDTPEDIMRKLKKAYCPEGAAECNPVLDWCKSLIFPLQGNLHIARPEKFGGHIEYDSYEVLEKDFVDKKLHPADLKCGTAEAIIKILEPARKHFEKPEFKEMLEEMEQLIADG